MLAFRVALAATTKDRLVQLLWSDNKAVQLGSARLILHLTEWQTHKEKPWDPDHPANSSDTRGFYKHRPYCSQHGERTPYLTQASRIDSYGCYIYRQQPVVAICSL